MWSNKLSLSYFTNQILHPCKLSYLKYKCIWIYIQKTAFDRISHYFVAINKKLILVLICLYLAIYSDPKNVRFDFKPKNLRDKFWISSYILKHGYKFSCILRTKYISVFLKEVNAIGWKPNTRQIESNFVQFSNRDSTLTYCILFKCFQLINVVTSLAPWTIFSCTLRCSK